MIIFNSGSKRILHSACVGVALAFTVVGGYVLISRAETGRSAASDADFSDPAIASSSALDDPELINPVSSAPGASAPERSAPGRIPIARRRAPPAKGCQGSPSSDAENQLIDEISAIEGAFLDGGISLSERVARIKNLELESGTVRKGDRPALVALQDELMFSDFRTQVLLKMLTAGGRLDPGSAAKLAQLGLDDADTQAALTNLRERLQPYFDLLMSFSATYRPDSGWDFSGVDLSPARLRDNPKLTTAIMFFVSPSAGFRLRDPKRSRAVQLGSYVALPPSAKGAVTLLATADYQKQARDELARFQAAMQEFLEASRSASSFGELMSQARTKQGQTAVDVKREGAYRTLSLLRDDLDHRLGLPELFVRQLNQALQTANGIDARNYDQGLAKIHAAYTAMWSAPLLPVAFWLAPGMAAGAAGDFALAGRLFMGVGSEFALLDTLSLVDASTDATAAAVGASQVQVASGIGISGIFSYGSAAMRALVDSLQTGQSFWCYFKEESYAATTGTLSTGTKMAFLGLASPAVAASSGYLGLSQGVARELQMGFDFSSAIYFTSQAGIRDSQESRTCYQTLINAQWAADRGEGVDVVGALAASAYQTCLQAGIDVSFFFTGAAHLGVQTYRDGRTIVERHRAADSPSAVPASP